MPKTKILAPPPPPSPRALRLAIEYRPPGELRPAAANARAHTQQQIERLAAAIREFGFIDPIVLRGDGEILAGHARQAAALLLQLDAVPTIRAEHLNEKQLRAYMLADNRLAELAAWDDKLLADELNALSALDLGFDIQLTGFSLDDIAGITAPKSFGRTDPDAVPAPAGTPSVTRGEVWRLGPHRLMCGDATVAGDVQRLLDGAKPHLMVTDPPYGVDYDPDWRNRAARHSNGMGNRAIGAGATGLVQNDTRADWRAAWALFPGDVAYVWHSGKHGGSVQGSLEAAGLLVTTQIIWAKHMLVIGRGHYHYQHEPCFYAIRKGGKSHWQGSRTQSTVWAIRIVGQPGHDEERTNHGTQKPVECMRRPILNNSAAGEPVYEPFAGSGTTIIACQQEGRRCLAMEIDPVYVDLAIRRWQDFTGEMAVPG